jgi:hypothetical protein
VSNIITKTLFDDVKKYNLGKIENKIKIMADTTQYKLATLSSKTEINHQNILYLKKESDNIKQLFIIQEQKYNERITQLELTINELKQKI